MLEVLKSLGEVRSTEYGVKGSRTRHFRISYCVFLGLYSVYFFCLSPPYPTHTYVVLYFTDLIPVEA